jgi:hypothetical protein
MGQMALIIRTALLKDREVTSGVTGWKEQIRNEVLGRE